MGTPFVKEKIEEQSINSKVLNDISENGIVIFTPVSDLDNETTFEVTKSGGYSGSLVGGNYYVSFQDGLKNEHYSFSEIMNINMPKEYNLTLKDEGFFKGEIISSSELDKIQGSIIQILFESEDGVIHVVETEDADGTFGYGDDYEQIDLPNGDYTVNIDLEGYESFEDTFTVSGSTDKYTITLDPLSVSVTVEVMYTNATVSELPVANADVRFTSESVGFDETYTTDGNGTINQNMLPRSIYKFFVKNSLSNGIL